jgi:predicted TPR repeat methyltransferase
VASYDQAIELQPDYAQAYYNRGVALTKLGQLEAAVDSYNRAIQIQPDYAEAYYNRGKTLNDLGKLVEAVACFNKVLEISSDDMHDGARLQLARLGEVKMPDRTPESYMKSFYHSKAKVWDQATKAPYHGHQLVREAIDYVIEKEERLNILDLGCGTGSLADFLHSYASRLDGVDISPDMLERAAEREVYNNLVEEDLVQYLEETSNSYGLMVAAAVLIHFADLETVFSLVWDRLDEHGRFVFSLFQAAEEEVELNSFDMFAHSDQYIQQFVDRVGFRLCYQKEGIHEYRGIHAVVGVVYLLEKNSGC